MKGRKKAGEEREEETIFTTPTNFSSLKEKDGEKTEENSKGSQKKKGKLRRAGNARRSSNKGTLQVG